MPWVPLVLILFTIISGKAKEPVFTIDIFSLEEVVGKAQEKPQIEPSVDQVIRDIIFSQDPLNLKKNENKLFKGLIEDILKEEGTFIPSEGIIELNGGRGPGGGDSLYCGPSEENDYQGWYSFDFIQSRRNIDEPLKNEMNLSKSAKCLDYLNVIHENLSQKDPILAIGLRHFIDGSPLVGSVDKLKSVKRKWKPLNFGKDGEKKCLVSNITDENKVIDLPNCRTCQMFIRKYSKKDSAIIYFYHENQLEKFKERPRQCSYALLHEWARDFLPNSSDLYDFVSYLHGQEFFSDNSSFRYKEITEGGRNCFFHLKNKPMDTASLDLYFEIVSQVPATPTEVKEYRIDFLKEFEVVVARIEEDIETLEKQTLKGSGVPASIPIIAKNWLNKVKRGIANKEMTLGQAFQELLDLERSLPIIKGGGLEMLENPIVKEMLFAPSELSGPKEWYMFQLPKKGQGSTFSPELESQED